MPCSKPVYQDTWALALLVGSKSSSPLRLVSREGSQTLVYLGHKFSGCGFDSPDPIIVKGADRAALYTALQYGQPMRLWLRFGLLLLFVCCFFWGGGFWGGLFVCLFLVLEFDLSFLLFVLFCVGFCCGGGGGGVVVDLFWFSVCLCVCLLVCLFVCCGSLGKRLSR